MKEPWRRGGWGAGVGSRHLVTELNVSFLLYPYIFYGDAKYTSIVVSALRIGMYLLCISRNDTLHVCMFMYVYNVQVAT
jgi:hypothetical protein